MILVLGKLVDWEIGIEPIPIPPTTNLPIYRSTNYQSTNLLNQNHQTIAHLFGGKLWN